MSRNIVLCCDGTSNDVTGDSTNVLRLYRSLVRDENQLTYYDAGVGTAIDPTKKTRFGKWMSRSLDMGVGFSVRENVCAGYRFLIRQYQPGDRVFLFGFSRGAYAVRALAGMIHFLGLLRPEQEGLAQHAWAIYSDDDERLSRTGRFAAASRFKKSFSLDVNPRVHFLGAWDTVSSYGWIWNLRTVPYTSDNPSVSHVRHAVAIDERRAMFQPNLFRPRSAQHTSFRQVWFAGSHGDVGGGWPEERSGLAKITLAWMLQEAIETGLQVDELACEQFLGLHRDRPDLVPASVEQPVNESLRGCWWLLEWIPRRQWDPMSKPEKMRWFLPHVGRRRMIPEDAVFHESVHEKKLRDARYRPPNLR